MTLLSEDITSFSILVGIILFFGVGEISTRRVFLLFTMIFRHLTFHLQFQSHQIFHVFVVAAAFVHYHGISEIANYRLTFGDCLEEEY